jgi:hypothetical protein
VYENDKPIDPLTIKSQPKMPISEENKAAFNALCDSLVNRLTSIPMATANSNNEENAEETVQL